MPIDGGARDREDVGDALDRMGPRVVELLGVVSLVEGELRAPASGSPAGAGGGESVAGVGDDEFSLEFGQDGEHSEHRTSFRE